MSEKTKTTKSVSDHIRHLYTRLGEVESRLRKIETGNGAAIPPTSGTPPVDGEVLVQVVELEQRLKQLETENRALTQLCTKLQEHNEAISNLYVAKHRLHASFDATEIMRIVRDIMVELVGAKEFGIYLLDPRAKVLRRVTGGGTKTIPESVPLGEGHLGRSGGTGKPFYFEAAGATVRAPETPLAVIPLRSESDTIGVIAIWNLLPQKLTFTPVDHQLLELVADHAPAALKSAHLHQKSRAKAQR